VSGVSTGLVGFEPDDASIPTSGSMSGAAPAPTSGARGRASGNIPAVHTGHGDRGDRSGTRARARAVHGHGHEHWQPMGVRLARAVRRKSQGSPAEPPTGSGVTGGLGSSGSLSGSGAPRSRGRIARVRKRGVRSATNNCGQTVDCGVGGNLACPMGTMCLVGGTCFIRQTLFGSTRLSRHHRRDRSQSDRC
jgi:hypothetical protein